MSSSLLHFEMDLECVCVKRTYNGKKAQQQQDLSGDVDMEEEATVSSEHPGGQWSLFCTMTPLAETLLGIPVSQL